MARDSRDLSGAETVAAYTLAPSALGGIISVRQPQLDNLDTWYQYDRMGDVCLTTDAWDGSNGLRWQAD